MVHVRGPRRRRHVPAAAAVLALLVGARFARGGPGDTPPAAEPSRAASAPTSSAPSPAPAALPSAEVLVERLDQLLRAALQAQGATPAGPASDGALLRRVRLDLTGSLPTVEQARAFLAAPEADKREALVRRLVRTPEAAAHFAHWYGRLLLGRANVDPRRRAALEGFLASAWREGLPYDQLVTALLTARGALDEHGEAVYAAQFAGDTAALAGRSARLFLGLRIACAQCHDHPFDRWTQGDFAGLAAYFARTRVEKVPTAIDEANGVNGRAEQQAKQAESALARAKADLAKAVEDLAKGEAARAAAAKAYAPVEAQAKSLAEAAAKERGQAKALEGLRAEAEALAKEAEERAATKDLAEPLKAGSREQAKLAREAAGQAAIAAREGEVSAKAYEARAAKALQDGAAAKAALDKAGAEVQAAQKRRDALQSLVDGWPDLLARAERLRDLTRRLGAAVPDVVRGRHLAAGVPLPPDRYRVVDLPGKVTPRPKNPAKPYEGDGTPHALDGTTVAAGLENLHLREALAAWITAPGNPTFARAAVNRFAAEVWGRGLVDPVDDVGDGARGLAPEALDLLARDFVASGYDLQRLVTVLALALPARVGATGGDGPADLPFVRAPVRELQPEVLFRALTQALLPALPGDEQAGLGGSDETLRAAAPLFDDGEDRVATAPRSGMRAALWLQNGGPLAGALSGRKDGLAARLVAADASPDVALETIFLAFLTRLPTPAERAAVLGALPAAVPSADAPAQAAAVAAAQAARLRVYEDLMWSLACSTEFLTNH